MPCPSHPPWFDHSNFTWRRAQVMKLLIMQFSSTSCHFISLQSKYSSQHPVLKSTLKIIGWILFWRVLSSEMWCRVVWSKFTFYQTTGFHGHRPEKHKSNACYFEPHRTTGLSGA
jgi:hypothetical protein